MCYNLAIVDYTTRDDNNDPLIKLVLGELAFPSLVLGELIVEKVILDLSQAERPLSPEMDEITRFPLALINIHNGEVTVFSDQDNLYPNDWEIDERFRTAIGHADHIATRLFESGKLVEQGVSEDALWASLGRFLLKEAPEVIGVAPDAPERLEALATPDPITAINQIADELARRFGNPDDMTEEQALAAIEEFLKDSPSAIDPFSITDTDADTSDDVPPAPKGLKIRGE